MSKPFEHINDAGVEVPVPKELWDTQLDSSEAQAARDAFFDEVKRSFETLISPGMIEATFYTRRMRLPAVRGNGLSDITDELTIHQRQPIAYALQTIEQNHFVTRFGQYPLNRYGRRAIESMIQADKKITDITF